jgi:hypothetical protein
MALFRIGRLLFITTFSTFYIIYFIHFFPLQYFYCFLIAAVHGQIETAEIEHFFLQCQNKLRSNKVIIIINHLLTSFAPPVRERIAFGFYRTDPINV